MLLRCMVRCFIGFWASYNVPYYQTAYNMSGYPALLNKTDTDFHHWLAPRSKIFKRDQGYVHDMASMQHLIRYNGTVRTSL